MRHEQQETRGVRVGAGDHFKTPAQHQIPADRRLLGGAAPLDPGREIEAPGPPVGLDRLHLRDDVGEVALATRLDGEIRDAGRAQLRLELRHGGARQPLDVSKTLQPARNMIADGLVERPQFPRIDGLRGGVESEGGVDCARRFEQARLD